LFHELTTPLGLQLDRLRQDSSDSDLSPLLTPMRSFGTYAVWFPRGLLLRLAARDACRKLIEGWMSDGTGALTPEASGAVQALAEQVAANPELQMDSLTGQIEALAPGSVNELAASPAEALTRLMATFEE